MEFDYLTFEDNLAQYILGLSYDIDVLVDGLSHFSMCKFSGYIFRGLSFNHPMCKEDIREQELCSWSTDLDVAINFAKNRRYGIVLVKKSNGISVSLLLNYLRDNNQMVSEKLKKCSSKYEKEVLDAITIDTVFMEPM